MRDWKKRGINFTRDAYEHLLVEQGYVCGICGGLPISTRLAVDHDHRSGDVRGLLCRRCNTALGSFRDSTELLRSAIKYLDAA
jgi:hypothetical protein